MVVNPIVTNVTSNTFSLDWSFPFECFDYVEMGEISTTVEFDGIETEIKLDLNLKNNLKFDSQKNNLLIMFL